MKFQKFLFALTAINLCLFVYQLLGINTCGANGIATVVRASSLEIIDEHGRVRASIKVQPAEIFKSTGKHYPESVVLRLIDPEGRPEVKIAASKMGGGLSFVGETDETQVKLGADGADSSLVLKTKDGKQKLIKP